MSRKFLIAANWKMHRAPEGALDAPSAYATHTDVDVVVFPTFLDLQGCIDAKILTGPQYGHTEEHGAHTGDVSLKMCKDLGCVYALCGHSDRREEHRESDEEVAAQAITALELGLHPIVCIGETREERDAGDAKNVVQRQLKAFLDHSQFSILNSQFSVAYEPIWAISRGDPNTPAATKEDAQEMHALIRSLLPEDRRGATRILYGGSMKPENAEELLSQPDIDGGLVGGASLKPDAFKSIVETALSLSSAE